MPRPTEPAKRVCYADDLAVWATGVKIPDPEDSIISYLEENSLLISDPKSSVTLFSPDPNQAKAHPRMLIEDSQLRSRESIQQKQYPQCLGRHILGTTEGNNTNDLQGRWEIDHQLCCSCLEYKLRDPNYRNISYTQNEAPGIATGCHKMSSVDHLHV